MTTTFPALAAVILADGDLHAEDALRLRDRASTPKAEAGPPWAYRAEWEITPAGDLTPAPPVYFPGGL